MVTLQFVGWMTPLNLSVSMESSLKVNVFVKKSSHIRFFPNSYIGKACNLTCPITEEGLVCNNHGDCKASENDEIAVCSCDSGYYGELCSNTCPGLIETMDSVLECSGHGVCNKETMTCTCESGVSDTTTCAKNDCSEKTCINGTCNGGQCECNTNYYGHQCDIFCSPQETCHGHGLCNAEGVCECAREWTDMQCDVPCTSSMNCSSHGVCDVFGDCMCHKGFSGDFCERRSVGYVPLIVFLLVCNGVVSYLWYRSRVRVDGSSHL